MLRFLAYFAYVARHRWFVFKAACRLGIPGLGLVHDLSKYSHAEWGPYACQFFNSDGSRRDVRNPDGSYDPNAQAPEFKRAWLHHQRNRHHWQAWISLGDAGAFYAIDIPDRFCREMVADWMGAGMAISGRKNPYPWYQANKAKMILHQNSRTRIEAIICSQAVQGWQP